MVTLVVAHLDWVDFGLEVPSSCHIAQTVLPNSHLPKQNGAGLQVGS